MRTAATEMFDLQAPIFAFSHCRDVVAAVSRAGGMGTLGTSHVTAEQLEVALTWIDNHCGGRPYGVDVLFPSGQPRMFEELTADTVNEYLPAEHRKFVADLLERHKVPQLPAEESAQLMREYMDGLTRTHKEAEKRLEVVFRHPQAQMIVSALGVPPRHVVDRAHSLNVRVAGLVGHPKHASRHAAGGVDIIIAQGWEAAGHTGDISTMVLVPEVVDAVAPIPVLAAGGIGRGRQVAAALALGAAGVWTGTVWLGTVESEVVPELKEKLFAASSSDTLKSKCGTGKPARRLRSAWVEAWETKDAPEALPMPLQSMLVNEALERIMRFRSDALLSYPAGQGVGQLREETSVKQVVYQMLNELLETVERVNAEVLAE
jgi:NAD(P)H-dependent flavin oxidoreductase YrpB (nitropropane dioxygenase family)